MISIRIDFTWKTALQAANALVFQHRGEYLSDIEIIVLHGAWHNCTYEQIAQAKGYTSSYLCKDIGHSLWKNLSAALKIKVSKTNFKAALKREWQKYTQAILSQNRNRLAQLLPLDNITLFEGLIALNSTFYLERSPIETICYEEILQPGSLIRIEGAKWMGKTSLVSQILDRGNLQAQRTVYLDFDTIEREVMQDVDRLLIWLSTAISYRLNLENRLQDYWNKNVLSSNNDCTAYFENHILTGVKNGIILALDNIDRLFCYREVAKAFLKLLCHWHKKAMSNHYWSQLKIVTTQSIKADMSLDNDCFFHDLGKSILLEQLNFQQVKSSADFYQLDWSDFEIWRLMDEVGGNPYLIRLAMYQTKIKNLALMH